MEDEQGDHHGTRHRAGDGTAPAIVEGYSDDNDIEQLGESGEVSGIARIQRQIRRECGRGNEQIRRSASARSPASRGDRRVHAAVRTSYARIHGKGFERRLGALKPILPARPFCRIPRGVRTRRELGQRDRGDGQLARQALRIDRVQVDHHRRVYEPARVTGLSHAASGSG